MKIKGWTTCTLGDVVETFSGGTPNRADPDYFGGGIPWIKSGELNIGWVSSTKDYLTEQGLKDSAAKLVEPGTTMIALYGATAGTVGRTKIKAAINQAILAVIPDRKVVDPDFLPYLLRDVGKRLLRILQGAQPNLNAGMVRNVTIDLPPVVEQVSISRVLMTWDEALEKLDALIAAKKRRKQALMQHLLTGRKRFRGFGGHSWIRLRMGDVLERVYRPSTSGQKSLDR